VYEPIGILMGSRQVRVGAGSALPNAPVEPSPARRTGPRTHAAEALGRAADWMEPYREEGSHGEPAGA
jgi:hypothetical protein